MSVIAIVRPLTISAIGGTFENVSRLLTPDPKEAAITAGGAKTIDIDLGAATLIDTLFLGYTNDPGTGTIAVSYGTSSYTTTALSAIPVAQADEINPRRHFLTVLAAPILARYIRLSATFAASYSIGTVAVGLAFRPAWGIEYGEGRFVEDASAVERLFSGAFGIDQGAITGGWGFTLGDLQPAEIKALFLLVKSRGISRTLLICEDPDQTAGLNERIHWGLLQKLSAYERLDPQNSKWQLTISDWG